MALSQPRSEAKIDEADAGIKRGATDEDFNSGGAYSDEGEHGQGGDRKEPLAVWRTESVPAAFQGRSTSSFINRFVRAWSTPVHASCCCGVPWHGKVSLGWAQCHEHLHACIVTACIQQHCCLGFWMIADEYYSG